MVICSRLKGVNYTLTSMIDKEIDLYFSVKWIQITIFTKNGSLQLSPDNKLNYFTILSTNGNWNLNKDDCETLNLSKFYLKNTYHADIDICIMYELQGDC